AGEHSRPGDVGRVLHRRRRSGRSGDRRADRTGGGDGHQPRAWRPHSGRVPPRRGDQGHARRAYFFSILTVFKSTRAIGASPLRGDASIASTAGMPSTTRPNAVYWPSSAVDVPVQMKNELCALSSASARAIDTIPLTCFVSLNSGARLWTSFCCFSVSGAVRLESAPV